MPDSNGSTSNGQSHKCVDCGRTGAQRFEKVSGSGKRAKFACTDKVACLKRQGKPVTAAAKRDRAKRYPAQSARQY